MTLVVAPTLQDVYAPIVSFIRGVTGLDANHVVQGLPNRAAMPTPGFVSFQAIHRARLRTNLDLWDETTNPPMSAGIEEGVELRLQIDCYGPSSCDWANMLSATLRDEYGCTQLATLAAAMTPPFTLQPLYADDAAMVPLVDGEEQYEERWMVDARFQINPVTTTPQEYADVLNLLLINVEERYPA